MIECKTKQGSITLNATGDDVEIFADTMVIIKSIYKALAKTDKKLADEYRESIAKGLTDPDSPFFEGVTRDD